jgi:CHAD domain-containing protein
VLAGRIRDRSRVLSADDRRIAAELVVLLEAEIVVAREVVIRFLDSERYAALLLLLAELAANPPVTDAAAEPAAEAAGPIARRPWRRLRKAVRELPKNPADTELHQVRILAKRSRYAAQAVAPVVGEPATEFATAVAEVQTILGEHQDAVTTEAWLKSVPADGRKAFVAGVLAGLERAAALEARSRWPEAWKQVDRPELRAWLEAKPSPKPTPAESGQRRRPRDRTS